MRQGLLAQAFAFAVALLTALSAQARIGWTLEECIKNYGPDTPVDGADQNGDPITWHTFNVHGWDVTVIAFKNDKVTDISGKLEVAQHIANHESPRTTKLYDRRQDEISLDEIERIAI
jgi:hypothetical protein